MSAELDAVVVGSGPNGLAAAVVLCAAGLAVGVYEMGPTPGGGCRTEELTLPGFHHDVCSAGHPLAIASGFFRRFDLASRGVRLLQPEVAFAHPLDGGRAGAVMASLDDTAAGLGEDAEAWRHLFRPLLQHHPAITDAVLSSMRAVPPQPVAVGRFGLLAVRSAAAIAGRFSGDEARGLFAGVAAHGMMALDRPVTGGVGLLLSMLAQAVGFPLVEGGSAGLVSAMVEAIEQRGGEVRTGERVTSLAQ
ncbi:MAG: NAD(P)/FAD-dependent oxidoreductase, partial [Acidimicrobiales bacterium]